MASFDRRMRALRKQTGMARQFLDTVRRDPQIAVDLLAGLVGRTRRTAVAVAPGHTPPEGLADFLRLAHSSVHLAADADSVGAYVTDPAQFEHWVAIHSGWKGNAPTGAYVGAEFIERGQFMGIPAEVTWRVAALDDLSLELRGVGPMGMTLGFWITVVPDADGSVVYFDAGLAGQPIEGPLGSSVARSLGTALDESLNRLPDLIPTAGTGRRRGVRKPVLHHASGRTLSPSTPVIVGVGQVVERHPRAPFVDPSVLAVAAVRKAATDATGTDALLPKVDAVFSVSPLSWQYRDMSALVKDAIGAADADTVQSCDIGGDNGQVMVNAAAEAVAAGEYDVVVVTGAEAAASVALAAKSGVALNWPEQGPDVKPTRVIGVDRPGNNEPETAAELAAPAFMYPLIETAVRRRLGRSPKEHLQAIGELWSRFSAVAAKNENAWLPKEFLPDEISTASESNRLVASPYTKLLCANLQVDMASAVIVTSVAAAEAAGIAQDRWVFPHSGAAAYEEWFVSERADLAAAPAIAAIGESVLSHAGVTIDEIDHVDLYSCFPSAVQVAALELGLPTDDPDRPLTVTGGLTFGGGPGNNYGGHGIATMVERLRETGGYGLTTSLGYYLTKHAAGLYSTTPPEKPFQFDHPVVDYPPSRPALSNHRGPGVLESYVVVFDRTGTDPEAAVASVLTPAGARVLVRTAQADVIAEMLNADPLGYPVTVTAGGLAFDGTQAVDLPEPPPAPILVERREAITIITVNRPKVRNAFDSATANAMERAIDAFEADPRQRVAIVTGAGGFFSAGMDLKAAARGEMPITEGRGLLGITGKPPVKPLIAAVEGPALAGGCELALAADLIVASREAVFGLPEPKRGLVAAAGGVLRFGQRLPRNLAMELTLTGEPLGSERLYEFGFVNRVTEPGHALEVAIELAERIVKNAPLSVAIGKQILVKCNDWTSDEAFEQQLKLGAPVAGSDDAAEGIRAFAENRDPVWTGR